jgi:hypothetical protein
MEELSVNTVPAKGEPIEVELRNDQRSTACPDRSGINDQRPHFTAYRMTEAFNIWDRHTNTRQTHPKGDYIIKTAAGTFVVPKAIFPILFTEISQQPVVSSTEETPLSSGDDDFINVAENTAALVETLYNDPDFDKPIDTVDDNTPDFGGFGGGDSEGGGASGDY